MKRSSADTWILEAGQMPPGFRTEARSPQGIHEIEWKGYAEGGEWLPQWGLTPQGFGLRPATRPCPAFAAAPAG